MNFLKMALLYINYSLKMRTFCVNELFLITDTMILLDRPEFSSDFSSKSTADFQVTKFTFEHFVFIDS